MRWIWTSLTVSTLMALAEPATPAGSPGARWQPVAGTGIHYFTTGIEHWSEPTATGLVKRSTETIDLEGDLLGRILYQPLSVFDYVKGTLVNTGVQVFSGTILGSDPVLLHDNRFRFEVDLATGATTGRVYLVGRFGAPRVRCRLRVVGTGMTPEGDATFAYEGWCRLPRP